MIRDFGTTADGIVVQEITLKKGPLEAAVLTYGATIRDLKFNGQPMISTHDDLEGYTNQSSTIGAITGIPSGVGDCVWSLEQHDKGSVLLKCLAKKAEASVEVLVRYTLTGAGALRVKITATTDNRALVDLAPNLFFNLDGSPTVADHTLEIVADTCLSFNEDGIPEGDVRNVAWTPYDFRESRKLGQKLGEGTGFTDRIFCVADAPREGVEFAAAMEDLEGDCRMEVWTTEPHLQLDDCFASPTGLCIKPQRWSKDARHGIFTKVFLRPDETYTHVTEFRFS